MDRRNFLAIIPSLSAIPFIGKDIVKKSDRIEIFQPEQMEQEINGTDECEVHIVKKGRVLAKGWIESVECNKYPIDTTCRDNAGAKTFVYGPWNITAQVRIHTPIDTDGWNAMHDITTHGMRLLTMNP